MAIMTKAQELAVWGINPFMPQLGVYCGGFQGPLYPQPTTLVIQSIRDQFEPLDFRTAEPTDYILNAYVGLGKGNPGVDWRNPGHLLGMMDTFFRMAHGLNVIKGIRDGLDRRDTIVDIQLPFRNALDYKNIVNKTISDLYPEFSEIPTDYIDTFLNDKVREGINLGFDPSVETLIKSIELNIINTVGLHIPQTTQIDFNKLFENFHIDSYFILIASLRKLFTSIVDLTQSSSFNDLSNQVVDDLVTITNDNGTIYLPGPFSRVSGNSPPVIGDGCVNTKGHYHNINHILTRSEALSLINQDGLLHEATIIDSDNIQSEFRTLTELNSIINVLPLQVHGLSYTAVRPTTPVLKFRNAATYTWEKFLICDVVINSLQLEEGKTLNINGNIVLDFEGTLPLLGSDLVSATIIDERDFTQWTENIRREFAIYYRVTNEFCWDKEWFGLEKFNFEDKDERTLTFSEQLASVDSFCFIDFGGNPACNDIISTSIPASTTFAFNKTLSLPLGCSTTMIRILIESQCDAINVNPPRTSQISMKTDRMDVTINVQNIFSKTFSIDSDILIPSVNC